MGLERSRAKKVVDHIRDGREAVYAVQFCVDALEIGGDHGPLKVEIREMCMGKSAASKRTPLMS